MMTNAAFLYLDYVIANLDAARSNLPPTQADAAAALLVLTLALRSDASRAWDSAVNNRVEWDVPERTAAPRETLCLR